MFDAVYIPGGNSSVAALTADGDALHFVEEAYKHCKPIAANEDAIPFLEYTCIGNNLHEKGYDRTADGVVTGKGNISRAFIQAIKQHRFWEREKKGKVPA